MISYKKLWHWCLDHNITRGYLHDELKITWPTISKLRDDEYVKMQTLEKICLHFNLTLNDIVDKYTILINIPPSIPVGITSHQRTAFNSSNILLIIKRPHPFIRAWSY